MSLLSGRSDVASGGVPSATSGSERVGELLGSGTISAAQRWRRGSSGRLCFSSGSSKAGNSGRLCVGPGPATVGRGARQASAGSGARASGGGLTFAAGRSIASSGGRVLTVGGEGTAASSGLVRITSANGGTAGASGRLAFSSARGGRERRGGEPGVRHVDGRSRRRRGRERGRRDERVWGIGIAAAGRSARRSAVGLSASTAGTEPHRVAACWSWEAAMPERPEVAADPCSARERPPEETAARCSSDLARRQEVAEAAFARVWAAARLRTRGLEEGRSAIWTSGRSGSGYLVLELKR